MQKIKYSHWHFLASIAFGMALMYFSPFANAQQTCIKVDQIARWEVLDGNKTVVYDQQGNSIAFVIFLEFTLKRSGENFRFFSSSICRNDRVQISGGMNLISNIEPIRK